MEERSMADEVSRGTMLGLLPVLLSSWQKGTPATMASRRRASLFLSTMT